MSVAQSICRHKTRCQIVFVQGPSVRPGKTHGVCMSRTGVHMVREAMLRLDMKSREQPRVHIGAAGPALLWLLPALAGTPKRCCCGWQADTLLRSSRPHGAEHSRGLLLQSVGFPLAKLALQFNDCSGVSAKAVTRSSF